MVRQINNSRIAAFMSWAGITYEISGKWAWPVDHDSMRVNLQKDYFHRYSTDSWGHLPEFVANYYGLPVNDPAIRTKLTRFKNDSSKLKRVEKWLEQANKFDWSTLETRKRLNKGQHRFLTEIRGFSSDTIAELEERQLIAGGHRQNLYFPWYDSNHQIVGADIQGTFRQKGKKRPYFKGVVAGSRHAVGWTMLTAEGVCERAMVFESPFDACAYYQLNRAKLKRTPTLLISLGGVQKLEVIGTALKNQLETRGGHLQYLGIALDRDDAGRGAVKALIDAGLHETNRLKISIVEPTVGKDWNEQLLRNPKAGVKNMTLNQIESDTKESLKVEKSVTAGSDTLWPKQADFEAFITENRNLLGHFSFEEVREIAEKVPADARQSLVTRKELSTVHLYPTNDKAVAWLNKGKYQEPLFNAESFESYSIKGEIRDYRMAAAKRINRLSLGRQASRQTVYAEYQKAIQQNHTVERSTDMLRPLVKIAGEEVARNALNISPRKLESSFHFSARQTADVKWSKLTENLRQELGVEVAKYAQSLVIQTKVNLAKLPQRKDKETRINNQSKGHEMCHR